MKIAVCTIAYNEEEYIGACIEQFKPFGLHHLVLLSSKSWNGTPVEPDKTKSIAIDKGAEVIVQHWLTEHEQRNFGLARLYDYDYVLIVDADELYEKSDIEVILKDLEKKEPCYRADKMITYWKNSDYIFEPADGHKPIIAVNPKKVKFYEHRQPMPVEIKMLQDYQPVVGIKIHHFSWAKKDEKIKEKISSFSHADIIRPYWYEDIWQKWTPEMTNIRAYGIEVSKAVYNPAPQEIIDLINKGRT